MLFKSQLFSFLSSPGRFILADLPLSYAALAPQKLSSNGSARLLTPREASQCLASCVMYVCIRSHVPSYLWLELIHLHLPLMLPNLFLVTSTIPQPWPKLWANCDDMGTVAKLNCCFQSCGSFTKVPSGFGCSGHGEGRGIALLNRSLVTK